MEPDKRPEHFWRTSKSWFLTFTSLGVLWREIVLPLWIQLPPTWESRNLVLAATKYAQNRCKFRQKELLDVNPFTAPRYASSKYSSRFYATRTAVIQITLGPNACNACHIQGLSLGVGDLAAPINVVFLKLRRLKIIGIQDPDLIFSPEVQRNFSHYFPQLTSFTCGAPYFDIPRLPRAIFAHLTNLEIVEPTSLKDIPYILEASVHLRRFYVYAHGQGSLHVEHAGLRDLLIRHGGGFVAVRLDVPNLETLYLSLATLEEPLSTQFHLRHLEIDIWRESTLHTFDLACLAKLPALESLSIPIDAEKRGQLLQALKDNRGLVPRLRTVTTFDGKNVQYNDDVDFEFLGCR